MTDDRELEYRSMEEAPDNYLIAYSDIWKCKGPVDFFNGMKAANILVQRRDRCIAGLKADNKREKRRTNAMYIASCDLEQRAEKSEAERDKLRDVCQACADMCIDLINSDFLSRDDDNQAKAVLDQVKQARGHD